MAQSYKIGTVTVTNGSTAVTGSGTAWELALITGGLFTCAGFSAPCTVVSDTALTLDIPFVGTTGAGRPYSIFRETAQAASAVEANDRLAEVAQDLRGAPVAALAGLTGAANKLPYFNGANTMALADLTSTGRNVIAAATQATARAAIGAGTGNGNGDVIGPSSSVDGASARFSGVTGKLIAAPSAGFSSTDTNLDNYLTEGAFITPLSGLTNLPSGWPQSRYVLEVGGGSSYAFHILHRPSGGYAHRTWSGTSWTAWAEYGADASLLTSGALPNARVSATLTADKAYRRGNILGAVSQSGGVPTGGLIEAGTNSNGQYSKYADGTLICRKSVTVNVAASSLFTDATGETWAAAFATAPFIAISAVTNYGNALASATVFGVGINSFTARVFNQISSSNTAGQCTANAIGIGWWF